MIIGITGKSGSGKTTVTDLLNKNGDYEIIHVDDVTHLILEIDEVRDLLILKYGNGIVLENGQIDRKKLGAILFNDSERMKEYNIFIYSYLEKYIDSIINNSDKHIIVDWMQLPLTKYFLLSDFNILVEAPLEIRKKRVQKRDGIDENYFINREQNSLNYNSCDFDFVIVNDGNDLENKMDGIVKILERKN